MEDNAVFSSFTRSSKLTVDRKPYYVVYKVAEGLAAGLGTFLTEAESAKKEPKHAENASRLPPESFGVRSGGPKVMKSPVDGNVV